MFKKNEPNSMRMPEGCKHLTGNFFLVPFKSIRLPDSVENKHNEYNFRNPRLLTDKGEEVLLNQKLSKDLRDSIKNRTLLNPLICRWIKDGDSVFPVLTGGDRRYRALEHMIRNNEEVIDPRSVSVNDNGQWNYSKVTADVAYEFVPCQVFSCNSDLDALALAWAENKSRVDLTDGHEIAEVIKLREAGATDSRIMDILQRDQRWLADTDRLIAQLDGGSLADLLEGRLDRNSAIELTAIEDEKIRNQVRVAANEMAQETSGRRIARIQRKIEMAEQEQEIAAGSAIIAENEEEREEAEEEVERQKAQINTLRTQRTIATAPITTAQDIRQASEAITGQATRPANKRGPKGGSRKMRESKIKEGKEMFVNLIRANGQSPDNTFTAHVDAMKLLVKIFDQNILANNPDWMQTLRNHYSG
jgi:hypothetical protein